MLHHFYLHKCAGCWSRGLISVCSATHATQSQHSGKSCQWYISPLWTDIQHKMVLTVNILILHLTYGRRHCVTKLTSFADRVFTAFRVLTVDQAVWAKKCHHRSCIWFQSSNLTSIVVNLVVALLFQLNIAARSVPAGFTQTFPGHPVGRHCAGAMTWSIGICMNCLKLVNLKVSK